MRALASGPAGNYLAGHVYTSPHDLSEEQARSFVDGGYAEEIAEMETVDAPAELIETAVIKAPKPRRMTKRG